MRNPTAQIINIHEKYILIDCGEGTQMQIRKFGVKLQKVDYIFISHLHGDHYLGLPGLLQTLHLLGRTRQITVFGPPRLKEILDLSFAVGNTRLRYPFEFVATQAKQQELLVDDKRFTVHSFPLKHKVPTTGFVFKEKESLRAMKKSAIIKYDIPVFWMQRIKEGQDMVTESGEVIANELLSEAPPKTRSYAFCSDTAYYEPILEHIQGVDVLYHEASFGEAMKQRAKETLHSTAKEAGEIAKQAAVGQLLIGHFSARYKDETECLEETQSVFPNTLAAYDGMLLPIGE